MAALTQLWAPCFVSLWNDWATQPGSGVSTRIHSPPAWLLRTLENQGRTGSAQVRMERPQEHLCVGISFP